jgi:hypothetical protein
MSDEAKKPRLRAVETPSDGSDLDSLWLDSSLGDGITDVHYHEIPVGKPKDFFRTHPDKRFRRRTEIYTHKPEGAVEETHYLVDKPMRGRIDEAQLCTLAVVIYRDGSPRLWPLKLPKDGDRDLDAWKSARNAAGEGLEHWVKLVWKRRAYLTRKAQPGYAPDPDWSKLPSFDDMVRCAFGEHGIIRDTDHPIYRELFGSEPRSATEEESESDDDL